MPTRLLTYTKVDKAKPADPSKKSFVINDGDRLRINVDIANNRKSWEFFYQSPTHHKRRKTSFGVYPINGTPEDKKASIEKARNKAQEYRDLIDQNIDPIDYFNEVKTEVKREEKGRIDEVCKEWLKYQKQKLAPSTYIRKERLFKKMIIAPFGKRNIKDIGHGEITKALQIKAKQSPEVARRLLNDLNDLWKYACSLELAEVNIIQNIHTKTALPPRIRRTYAKITDLETLAELYKAIEAYGGAIETRNALRLAFHAPLRAGNLVGLRWAWVDFDNELIKIPREFMKRKNGADFILPLNRQANEILREQYSFTSHKQYVFAVGNGHLGEETPGRALQRMGFNDETRGRKQRLHSFRGTFRSLCDTHQDEHGASFEVKEATLDHLIDNETTRAYTDRANYTNAMRKLMQWWGNFLERVAHDNY